MKLLKFLFSLIFISFTIYSNAQDVTDITSDIPTDIFTDETTTTGSITDTPITDISPTVPTSAPSMTADTVSITTMSISTTTISHSQETTSTNSNNIVENSYSYESNNYYMFSATNYPLATIIVRLNEYIDTEYSDQCHKQDLHLRIIEKNENDGKNKNETNNNETYSIRAYDVTNTIKDFNFCQNPTWQRDLIQIFPLLRGYAMITYLDNSTSYEEKKEKGMILNLTTGVFVKAPEIPLGSVSMTERDVTALGQAVVNAKPENGFIWVNRVNANKSIVNWSTFSITNSSEGFVNGTSTSSGNFSISTDDDLKVIRTLDGGYGFIIAGNSSDNSSYPWKVNVRFIRPQKTVVSLPFLLYQREDDVKSLKIEYCDNSHYEPGIECIFILDTNTGLIYIRVEFFISGAVKKVSRLKIDNNYDANSIFKVNQIFQVHDSYIVSGYYNDTTLDTEGKIKGLAFTGKIYNNNGEFREDWSLPKIYPPLNRMSSSFEPLSNETSISKTLIPLGSFFNDRIWMIYGHHNVSSRWGFSIANLSSLNPYPAGVNQHINSTFPPKGSKLLLGGYPDNQNITIRFDRPISLSVGNITICQANDNFNDDDFFKRRNIIFGRGDFNNEAHNRYNIRQTLNAQNLDWVKLMNDSITVKVIVLNSTFIVPNKEYFVIIDDDFVRDSNYDEPLTGIERSDWNFNIGTENETDSFGIKTSGLVRLTTLASRDFYESSKSDQSIFLNELRDQLTKILALSGSKLQSSKHWQWDSNVKNWQILLKLTIYPGVNKTADISVRRIVDSLDDLIRHRDVSLISQYSITSQLDSSYGFLKKQSVWDRYGFKLIGVGIAFLIIGVLALLSYKSGKDKTGYLPFKLFLIILDFCLDVAFLLKHGKYVYQLFYPSLLCIIIPICFNTVISFIIIIRELSYNPKFFQWFREHHNFATIFTCLSVIDVEAFSLINSRLTGLSVFSAPFSLNGESLLFWACATNFVIEDTPQLIIQIYYIVASINYDIVPFLNLISASTLFIVIVLGHIYKLYRYKIDDKDEDDYNLDNHLDVGPHYNANRNVNHNVNHNVVEDIVERDITGKGKGKIGGMGGDFDAVDEAGRIEYVVTPEEPISPVKVMSPPGWLDSNHPRSTISPSSSLESQVSQVEKYTIGPKGKVIRKKTGTGEYLPVINSNSISNFSTGSSNISSPNISDFNINSSSGLGAELSENLDVGDNIEPINNKRRKSKDNAGVNYMIPTDLANMHIEDEISTENNDNIIINNDNNIYDTSIGINSRHFYDGLPGPDIDVNNVPSISVTSPTSNVIDIESSSIPLNTGIPSSSDPSP
ncbi:hypothetical protein Glove_349g72 [Diversispora epigaea]|uniref:SbsA Ig-like domain-containing protein n=1 Tax=Diversispora epigaea TaxID=1348612 RepID=A0A397HDP5_9GLOM|nr:hypothetical protein Glove_349g72 [Diversispora epigaea]